MNYGALKARLSNREHELRRSNTDDQIEDIRAKIATDIERISTLRKKVEIAAAKRQFKMQLRVAYDKLIYGRTRFMSLDVERTEAGHFQEVGVTLFRGREIETYNYRIKGVQRGPVFLYGTTMEVDFDVMKNLILMHANTADVYVGHSFHNDLKHLEAEGIILPRKFYYDTSVWSKALFGYTQSLINLTREYNTAGQMFHCAGNDSRYTADVFLKMVFTHFEEYFPRPEATDGH